jgi:hypothetical protein
MPASLVPLQYRDLSYCTYIIPPLWHQIRPKIIFTFTWCTRWPDSNVRRILQDTSLALGPGTPIDLYVLVRHTDTVVHRTNVAACTNLERLEGWRITVYYCTVYSTVVRV